MLKVEILGGVGEYGRNCFYVENNGHAILLDCGIMNNHEQPLPKLTEAHAAKLDAVFITHSHLDHTGALFLLDDWQCQVPIVMSEMTARQLGRTTHGRIMTFETASDSTWIHVSEHIRFQWGYTGHLIGSVWYAIEFCGEHIFYSGDYVSDSYLLKSTLPLPNKDVWDLAIIDSGHIEKRIDNMAVLNSLRTYIDERAPGPVIIPSSYSGKTADLAVYLFQNGGAEVVVDSSLHAFFKEYADAPDYLRNEDYQHVVTRFREACLGVAMCEDAATVHFIADDEEWKIKKMLDDNPKASIVLTGYSKEKCYEQQLAEDRKKTFFYKSHPDYDDLIRLTERIQTKEMIYFHNSVLVKKKAHKNDYKKVLFQYEEEQKG